MDYQRAADWGSCINGDQPRYDIVSVGTTVVIYISADMFLSLSDSIPFLGNNRTNQCLAGRL